MKIILYGAKYQYIFFENTNQGSSIEQIMIDRVQGIAKCPEGFFRQFALETNRIFNAGLDNIGKDNI